ncbi:hypothetical protein [Caulobacter sp. S45]|uniref:hypothetical protein n=1 Tax=Caulobacter sp. S45 TaxID=1641861 RepID=UPI00131C1CC7|nr:hypothetical protein [Caulobacter sp. S45]
MASSSSSPVSHLWYVQAGDGVWGPYTEARMAAFLAEGRIAAATPVSPWSAGPFISLANTPEFAVLSKPPGAAAVQPSFPTPRPPAPTAAAPQPAYAAPDVVPIAGAARPLLVWAFLAAIPPSTFQAALASFGPCVAIRTGLWLVRASMGPAALRNALSRHMRGGDTLLVVEASLEQAAWFNLDQVSEHDLRRLWLA